MEDTVGIGVTIGLAITERRRSLLELDERALFREAGRRAAAKRRRDVLSTCDVCGTPTVGTTKRHYCSDACRMKAYRRRLQEREDLEGHQRA